MITIIENFASPEEVQTLLDFAKAADWGPRFAHDPWKGRALYFHQYSPVVQDVVFDLHGRIQREISAVAGKPMFTDTVSLAKWEVGDMQHPHADGENPDGSPHPYPWREYGCILYLHTDFEGGEIYFPTKNNLTMKPEAGTLVFFTGTVEDLHGVTEVRKGTRYNLASFWTSKEEHRSRWTYEYQSTR